MKEENRFGLLTEFWNFSEEWRTEQILVGKNITEQDSVRILQLNYSFFRP